ncbi:GGDEF domain-containing protein [Ectobacillus ponti]|uniref:GGDEF domain-containing protein n=1 Tax=Ectobacillus ponti TaxID=2961894 RepID=A0AA41XC98_9BACI|nr:GGDEF domain-containing protein [Ectobacillus ponti]MCP8971043.1 GGDEF domain-containing protein [Ectobacillus ponti]
MKRIRSVEDLKRMIYLWSIPPIVLALGIYSLLAPHLAEAQGFYIMASRLLLVWYTAVWLLIYRKRFIRFVELGTLALLTFAHIATVYDGIFHSMAQGKEPVLGISAIWMPAVLLVFFLILSARPALIYSLTIFGVLLCFGVGKLAHVSHENLLSLCQFYIAYIVYIFMFYFAHYLFRLFAELENVKKRALADALTGIPNRHQIDIWLEERMEQRSPFSIIFFDMDHFKAINDTYGHKVGDSVLQELAGLVQKRLSEEQLFGRWGGEEFLILMPGPAEDALQLAEQLRQAIHAYSFLAAGTRTASFGVTAFRSGETAEALLDRADRGLYQSKADGRNRVTMT